MVISNRPQFTMTFEIEVILCLLQTISEGDSKHWILLMQTAETVNKLVAALQTPWEAQFQTQLPVTFN